MTALLSGSAKDASDDLRRLLITAGLVLGAFSIGAAAQSAFIYGAYTMYGSTPQAAALSLITRALVNLLSCAIALSLCAWVRLPRIPVMRQILTALAIAAGAALFRHGAQILVGLYPQPSMRAFLVEVVSAAVVILVAISLGMAQMLSQARLRGQERALAEQRLRATTALAALSEEELRVRRSVAENLHGGLQGRLVMVGVQLDRILDRWRAGMLTDDDRHTLEQVRREIDTLREYEVRQASHLLYPAGVDTSLAYALTRLVRRVPAQIAVEAHIDDLFDEEGEGADEPDDATILWRVALLRAAEEAISNALQHGAASRIRVQLLNDGAHRDRVVLIIDDDGAGMPESSGPRRGLALSEERLKRLGGSQRLDTSPWGGLRVTAELPVRSRHPLASA